MGKKCKKFPFRKTFFQKPLDKSRVLWYNINVNKRNEVNNNERNNPKGNQ